MILTKAQLIALFETGDTPDGTAFADLIESIMHVDDGFMCDDDELLIDEDDVVTDD